MEKMTHKKLSNEQIMVLEAWAENKKKTAMTDTEKTIVGTIETMKQNNWRGYRVDSKATTKEEAQRKLDELRRR
ncbi:hypothetical protein [Petroclostridium sp. X23]|uniref:hypothetical protein n=1 Tax=Petroclostridium sp. X23 TaxID=3045146 RepID=UPI0024ADA97E|nr:hypothetical protein [Petroclostridium sp. X23]WHH60409.1 hypothetical protein QKW49_06705 [Petroclostridium sp. X23]